MSKWYSLELSNIILKMQLEIDMTLELSDITLDV